LICSRLTIDFSFATPEICNQVIENYNGKPIGDGDEGSTLSIRFADTQAQKQLKNVTAERRQFKTNEYNTVVYGPSSPYQIHSNMAASFPSPLASRVPMGSAYWPQQLPLSSM
jgi:alpha-amylase/alpha-mannosidase (GH57 family)